MRRSLLQTELLLKLAVSPSTLDALAANQVTARRSLQALEEQGLVVFDDNNTFHLTPNGKVEARKLKDELRVKIGQHEDEITRLESVIVRQREYALAT